MRVTIVGARPYRVRVNHNVIEWSETVSSMQYDPEKGEVCADTEDLKKRGVRQQFISYLIRNNFLREVR